MPRAVLCGPFPSSHSLPHQLFNHTKSRSNENQGQTPGEDVFPKGTVTRLKDCTEKRAVKSEIICSICVRERGEFHSKEKHIHMSDLSEPFHTPLSKYLSRHYSLYFRNKEAEAQSG